MLHLALFVISKPSVNSNWSYSPETLNSGQNRRFFVLCNLKFNRWPWETTGHLFYVASSFVHHLIASSEFELELQAGTLNSGQNRRLFVPFDLEIWQMTLKTIGQFLYATSSFVHDFVAIGEFKLELQSGNAQFGSKSTIFVAVWPRNLTDDLEKQ